MKKNLVEMLADFDANLVAQTADYQPTAHTPARPGQAKIISSDENLMVALASAVEERNARIAGKPTEAPAFAIPEEVEDSADWNAGLLAAAEDHNRVDDGRR